MRANFRTFLSSDSWLSREGLSASKSLFYDPCQRRQLHLHQHRTAVDESQAYHAQQNNQTQFNNTYNQQLNMAVVTADPEIVHEAWAAVAAARHEEAAARYEMHEYGQDLQHRAQAYTQDVEHRYQGMLNHAELHVHTLLESARVRESQVESEAQRRHAQFVLETTARHEHERREEAARYRALEELHILSLDLICPMKSCMH